MPVIDAVFILLRIGGAVYGQLHRPRLNPWLFYLFPASPLLRYLMNHPPSEHTLFTAYNDKRSGTRRIDFNPTPVLRITSRAISALCFRSGRDLVIYVSYNSPISAVPRSAELKAEPLCSCSNLFRLDTLPAETRYWTSTSGRFASIVISASRIHRS